MRQRATLGATGCAEAGESPGPASTEACTLFLKVSDQLRGQTVYIVMFNL